MKEWKERKIEERKLLLESRANQSNQKPLELARQDVDRINTVFTLVSLLGPIVVSLLYLFLAIDLSSFVWWHAAIDGAATVILIVALLVLFFKLNIAQGVITKIETSILVQQEQINSLKKQIETLKNNQSLYVIATQLIGQEMKGGKTDIVSLTKILFAVIYQNLSKITSGDNITINLYELRNNRIKMILSTTRLHHCQRDSVNIPVLFKAENGLDIKDRNIQDYYCIKCLTGKVRGKDGKYILPDWISLAKEFKWEGWTQEEKQDILNSADREKCIEQGFKYNQYLGFKIKRDDGTIGYFEIIANEDTVIADIHHLNSVTHRLRETYSPLLSILWDISDISG